MNSADLALALDEWRRLTFAERQALRSLDWAQLNAWQQQKELLEHRIDQAYSGGPVPRHLLAAVQELTALERENQAFVQQQMSAIAAQKAQLTGASHILRKLRCSYVTAAQPNWASYS